MTNKAELAKQMEQLQALLAEESAKEEQELARKAELAAAPHAIIHVTVNNNVPISSKRDTNMGFTHNGEMYGTITLAKLISIENHGLETVLETPTGVKLSAEGFAKVQNRLNLTCFAQVPLKVFGNSRVLGSKLLKIRINQPLSLTTIQALGKTESGENGSAFTDPEGKLVYLTTEEVAAGVDPRLTPKETLLVTVLFEENDIAERYNPQQNTFNLAISSEEDLLAQLMSDTSFNTAKDASGLTQWRANKPMIDNLKELEDAAANEGISSTDQLVNEVLKPATKTRAKV